MTIQTGMHLDIGRIHELRAQINTGIDALNEAVDRGSDAAAQMAAGQIEEQAKALRAVAETLRAHITAHRNRNPHVRAI